VAKNGVVVFEAYKGFRDLRVKDSLPPKHPCILLPHQKHYGNGCTATDTAGKLNLDDSLGNSFPHFPTRA